MKTYKMCLAENLSATLFSSKPMTLNRQTTLDGVEPPPLTTVFKEKSATAQCPFDHYFIEHEKTEMAPGRSGAITFQSYIHRYPIYAYYLAEDQLLFLQGRKKAINDLIRQGQMSMNLTPLFIELNEFQDRIENIQMVWFRFYDGQFSSTSFHGHNIKSAMSQQDLFRRGRISTLSFSLSFEGKIHPLMLSNDGTIVLQNHYSDVSEELAVLHHAYDCFLEPYIERENPMRQQPTWKDELAEEIEEQFAGHSLYDAL